MSSPDLNATIAVTNVIIAGLAAWIVYRQYRLDRDRLRLDLYEKRYAVYSGVKRHLSKVLRDASLDYNDLFEFRRDVADRSFLFREDLVKYIEEIDHRSVDLITTEKLFRPLPVGEQRTKLVEKNSEHVEWLTNQLIVVGERFSDYLKFEHKR